MNQREAKRFACYLAAAELYNQLGSDLASSRVADPDLDRVNAALNDIIHELLTRAGFGPDNEPSLDDPRPEDLGIENYKRPPERTSEF